MALAPASPHCPHDDVRGVQVTEGIHPPRVPRVEAAPYDLYVLLRHRLLLQPHGFECLREALIPVDAHDGRATERVDRNEEDSQLGACSLRHSAPPCRNDDAVASVDPLFGHQPVTLEERAVLNEAPMRLIATVARDVVGPVRWTRHHYVGSEHAV